jgi:prepilin-type processing-associated H-X9-DG protein
MVKRRGLRIGWAVVAGALLGACASGAGVRTHDVAVSDAWINTRAENEITPLVTPKESVSISTQNGVVFLDGHVASPDRAEHLEQVATNIRGVREVKNNLVIKP